jgi:hypothetical protein
LSSLLDNEQPTGAGSKSAGGAAPNAARRQMLMLGLSVVIIAFAAFMFIRQFTGGFNVEDMTRTRAMVDAETGEVFERYVVEDGTTVPFKNPKNGKNTLFPAERCYWTREGNAKIKPTYVLLNQYKGQQGETLCPDCGRRVTQHNPMPPDEMMSKAREGK